MTRPDRRSPEAGQYRKLYRTSRWAHIRGMQLAAKPLCEWCRARGIIKPATVCHHENPKDKAHVSTFYRGPFTSLCAGCHDGPVKQAEILGYSAEIGTDGWPVDPRHPAHGG